MKRLPAPVALQIRGLLKEIRRVLGRNLVGVYLHGSLAMGGFNPKASDIDLLVITPRAISPQRKAELVRLLRAASRRPSPIEISFVSRKQIHPWRHAAPFELHFNETWRTRFERNAPRAIAAQRQIKDPDLAAHLLVTRARGVRLHGESIARALPAVPASDFIDSLRRDLAEASRKLGANPVYFVLNACRALGFFRERRVMSKEEGARWALRRMPLAYRPTIRHALDEYRGRRTRRPSASALRAFARYITREVDAYTPATFRA